MSDATFTLKDIAAALGEPRRKIERRATRESWPYTEAPVRGGRQRWFAQDTLPVDVQAALLKAHGVPAAPAATPEEKPQFTYDAEALWAWAATRTQKLRDRGTQRALLLRQVLQLMRDAGLSFRAAATRVGQAHQISPANLVNWYYGVNGNPGAQSFAVQDWAAALIPGFQGAITRAEIPAPAWDWFCAYYLTRKQPTLAEAYRRTVETARAHGWGDLPSERTFNRRVKSEFSEATRTFLRQGPEALAKLYPPQRRDKTVFAAGEAVVGDGLKFDRLYVRWPDGEILNTSTGWFWSDVRTNYLLAYRLAKTENTDLFRLATYDLTAITAPRYAWVDNTVVAANKAMTGRALGRHRFQDKPTDAIGLLLQLGIEPRFTSPNQEMSNPGAKPIERSFGIGGIHDKVATHPRFLNRGYSKETAIPYEEFAQVVAEEVVRFNRQEKRRTAVCRGVLSFEQAFNESFSTSAVRKLTDAQRALLLLMPEVVRADRERGEIRLKAGRGPTGQHRYWTEALAEYKTHNLVAYYDPENLALPISVYTLDGRFICTADHMGDTGFNDTRTAREHQKHKQRYLKASKAAARAQQRMSELEMATFYPAVEGAEKPQPGIVQGAFNVKRKVIDGVLVDTETGEIIDPAEQDDAAFVEIVKLLRANFGGRL